MSVNELAIPFVYVGEVLAAAIVLPVVAIIAVGLRFWLRSSGKAGIGLDDWITLAALVSLQCKALQQSRRCPNNTRKSVPCYRHGSLPDLRSAWINGSSDYSDEPARSCKRSYWISFSTISRAHESSCVRRTI